jgi:hypothetical protein
VSTVQWHCSVCIKFQNVSTEYIVSIFTIKKWNCRQYIFPKFFNELSQHNIFHLHVQFTEWKHCIFHSATTRHTADEVVASDVFACSKEPNALIQNNLWSFKDMQKNSSPCVSVLCTGYRVKDLLSWYKQAVDMCCLLLISF